VKVVILRGISGSGKSTLAKKLAQDFCTENRGGWATIVSADRYFLDDKGVYCFDASKLSKAHGECLRNFAKSVYDRSDDMIIVDNTNTTALEIAPYAQLALAFGHEVSVITVECDIETAVARNVHSVPRVVIINQFKRLEAETKKLYKTWNPSVWCGE
jgi:predicted kinase